MAQKDTAAAAFVRRIEKIIDLRKVDMHKIETQTTNKNIEVLRKWARHMYDHEARTKQQYERAYLVASDLRAITTSQRHSGKEKWRTSTATQRRDLFLHEKELKSLHEKHWAVEVDGRYYELVRDEYGSHFSSAIRIERCDRHIAARIFIGTTHCEHSALKEIGKAVIATQTRYELTRANCHRFVRVFTALAMCPYHIADTISCLPFDVEERIAANGLNKWNGLAGQPAGKIFGLSILSYKEDDMHYASRKVGQGAEWKLQRDDLGLDLRLTIRRLKQKTKTEDDSTIYLNEFKVNQEETSYCEYLRCVQRLSREHHQPIDLVAEYDPALLSRAYNCQTLDRSPYLSVVRFDRFTQYSIVPSGSSSYKPKESMIGMIKGPWGVTWSNGVFKLLHPAELIKDDQVWRDGDGRRLDEPESTLDRMLNSLRDTLFGRTSRHTFSYSLPLSPMIGLGVGSLSLSLSEQVKKIF